MILVFHLLGLTSGFRGLLNILAFGSEDLNDAGFANLRGLGFTST